MKYFWQIKGRNSYMTKAISMAIELDQYIMVTNMCVKFGEDWTNSFQKLDRKQSSGRTYVQTRATLYAATLWGHKNVACNQLQIGATQEGLSLKVLKPKVSIITYLFSSFVNLTSEVLFLV